MMIMVRVIYFTALPVPGICSLEQQNKNGVLAGLGSGRGLITLLSQHLPPLRERQNIGC
jgi:hypothetical protein